MTLNFIRPIIAFTVVVLVYIMYTPMKTVEEAEIVEQPIAKVVDQKQLACLAKNIFYEAGHESIMGQAAVARVVMNRINHGFGRTPCAVIYQSNTVEKTIDDETTKVKLCQFSWVCEGKGEPNKNNHRYIQAQKVAYDVLANDAYKDVVPKSALFFHNLQVDPLWPYKQVAKIGNHIFYSRFKETNDRKTKLSER